MARTIQQTVEFTNVSPDELFDIYVDPEKHSAATGSKASLSRKPGEEFSCFDGRIKGKNLAIIPKRLIVQSWRGSPWQETDLNSTLVLSFREIPGGGQIDLVQANVPDHAYDIINDGWPKYYWNPWRTYLKHRS